jgi:hypothetical protein
MDSNTHSGRRRERFAALAAILDELDREDLDRLTDLAAAEDVIALRPLVDRLQGQWLRRLARVDARGAAGAEEGVQFGSTAGWLRARLRMATRPAATAVRTARALFRGPLPETAAALCAGEIAVAHAEALAASTLHLPDHAVSDAEPVLLDTARHVDPPQTRRAVTHLQYTIDPDRADQAAQRRFDRRGLRFTVTLDDMIDVYGTMTAEAGQTLAAALEPLARPTDKDDVRTVAQRTADALQELARRHSKLVGCPSPLGSGPS